MATAAAVLRMRLLMVGQSLQVELVGFDLGAMAADDELVKSSDVSGSRRAARDNGSWQGFATANAAEECGTANAQSGSDAPCIAATIATKLAPGL